MSKIHTPDWVKNAIFYQIFPERFANGDPSNDPVNAQPWGTPPAPLNFMGGDLQGIIDHLDYLQDLGITALYLNPIFAATSNHKYNTFDYFKIDKHFGTHQTFCSLVDALHQRGMKLVMDGVFNHCGRGLFEFNDVLENGSNSSYIDWFFIEKFPLYPYEGRKKANYKSWWNIRSLPKFNTDNPKVRAFLLEIARYWIEQGADGWRLDVPNEIADHEFWREFREVVKGVNPDAYIVGEIWADGTPWLKGDQFDAVMNYIFRDLCVDFFAQDKINAAVFGRRLNKLLKLYPPEITQAQLNLFGSHDTARFLTLAHGDIQRMKLAIVFQMAYPGAPCIYYGDEVGMAGEGDPHCRGCFPWNEKHWNRDLHEFTKSMIALRRANPALRTGETLSLLADKDSNVVAFARWDENDLFLIVLNNSAQKQAIDLPLKKELPKKSAFQEVFGEKSFSTHGSKLENLTLPARSALILKGS